MLYYHRPKKNFSSMRRNSHELNSLSPTSGNVHHTIAISVRNAISYPLVYVERTKRVERVLFTGARDETDSSAGVEIFSCISLTWFSISSINVETCRNIERGFCENASSAIFCLRRPRRLIENLCD